MNNKIVFIDRFNEESKPINDEIFKEVATIVKDKKYNFKLEPAKVPRGILDESLIRQIIEAKLVIACINGIEDQIVASKSLNVIYELAFRQAAQRPIIAVSKNNKLENLPFYLRNIKIVKNIRRELPEVLNSVLNNPDYPDNRGWKILIETENRLSVKNAFDFYERKKIWEVDSTGSLRVFGSYLGAMSKAGEDWKNYTLSFKMKIVNRSLGVIVYGGTWKKGLMFQISTEGKRIIPHRLFPTVNAMPDSIIKSMSKCSKNCNICNDTWYDVAITIGRRIQIKLDKKTLSWTEAQTRIFLGFVSQNDAIIKDDWVGEERAIPKIDSEQLCCGKIGFRNSYGGNELNDEEALIRDVKVILEDGRVINIWPSAC